MKTGLYVFCLLITALPVWAQTEWSTQLIAASMRAKANAVIRYDSIGVQVQQNKSYREYRRSVVTVLREEGNSIADWHDLESRFIHLQSVKGTLLDSNGRKLKTLNSKDIVKQGGFTGSFIDDYTLVFHSFQATQYPYTVVYETVSDVDFTFYLPQWIPLNRFDMSVEKSIFSMQNDVAQPVRFYEQQFHGKKISTSIENKQYTQWTVEDLPALPSMMYFTGFDHLSPSVISTMQRFEIDRMTGSYQTWSHFSSFIYQLNQSRDALPPDVKKKARELTEGVADPLQKVIRLYKYLQSNYRYVSIQEGIGSWQPLSADFVCAKGYGDCKALSNLMVALLKEVGLHSIYALINTNSAYDALPENPASFFNHAVVCIPLAKDSVWLECTSNSLPAGFMSSFTEGQHALLVMPEKGKLVKTPLTAAANNQRQRIFSASINEQGECEGQGQFHYYGNFYERMDKQASTETKVQKVLEQMNIPVSQHDSFREQSSDTRYPEYHQQLQHRVNDYVRKSSTRLMFNASFFSAWQVLEAEPERLADYRIRQHERLLDSISLKVPPNYHLESGPVSFQQTVGNFTYEYSVSLHDAVLVLRKAWSSRAGTMPANMHREVQQLVQEMQTHQQNMIVLRKNE